MVVMDQVVLASTWVELAPNLQKQVFVGLFNTTTFR